MQRLPRFLREYRGDVPGCPGGVGAHDQHQLFRFPLLVDGTMINPVQSVRDLGIFIYADLVMQTHVQKMVSRCFAVLRQLRSIRHSVPATTFQTLIVSLVLSRLNYGNAVLAGLVA